MQVGKIRYLYAAGGGLVRERRAGAEVTVAALNAGDVALELAIPWAGALATDAMTGQQFLAADGIVRLTLPGRSGVLLI